MPTGGASSGRVCACSLRSRLVLKFNHQGHSRHWGYIRHKGHSIPTELEPLQAQMLGGLAVRPCHAGAPGRLSQQGPTNTQGPPAAMPDPDNRSRRAPGSSGLAGLWPVAGLGAMLLSHSPSRASLCLSSFRGIKKRVNNTVKFEKRRNRACKKSHVFQKKIPESPQ